MKNMSQDCSEVLTSLYSFHSNNRLCSCYNALMPRKELNSDQILSTRSKYNHDNLFVTVGTDPATNISISKCKRLGAIFDKHFNFLSQASQVCKSTYFSLKKIVNIFWICLLYFFTLWYGGI